MLANRAWTGVACFEGREKFIFGNFFAPHDAAYHEIEGLALELLDRLFLTRPKLLNLVPGMLVFQPEDRA